MKLNNSFTTKNYQTQALGSSNPINQTISYGLGDYNHLDLTRPTTFNESKRRATSNIRGNSTGFYN